MADLATGVKIRRQTMRGTVKDYEITRLDGFYIIEL